MTGGVSLSAPKLLIIKNFYWLFLNGMGGVAVETDLFVWINNT